ncbi:hypothetical protein [Thiomicrorhabdus indica]|uniref:hypothetical protein n=1 Tax=Thiomicrorhabdus indica TaxID=2267253 RepID=UPI002AA9200C|nr:hypothetical protein [Thiomicrorhabdus indica]
MVIKTFIALTAVASLSGCIAYKPVKYVADEYCAATDAQKAVIAEQVQEGLYPHELLLKCHAQVTPEKPKVTVSE